MSDIGKQRLIVHESANGWRGVGSTLPQYVSLVSDSLDYGVNYRVNENLIRDTRVNGTEAIILDTQKPEGEIKFIPTPNSIDHIFRSHYQKTDLSSSVKFGDRYQYVPEKGRLSWDGGVVYGTGGYTSDAGDAYGIGIERIYDHNQVIAFNNGICDELTMNVSAGGVLDMSAKFKFRTAGTLGTTLPWNGLYEDEYPAYSSFVGTFLIDDVAVPIERLSFTSKNNAIEKMSIGQDTRDSFTMGDFTIEGDFSLDFPDAGLDYLTAALQKTSAKIIGTYYNSEYNYLAIDIPNITYKTSDIKLNSVKNATIPFEAFTSGGTSPITVTLQKPSLLNSTIDTVHENDVHNAASYCSIAVDVNGNPAVAHRFNTTELDYSKWDGSVWNRETVLTAHSIYVPATFNSLHIGSDNVPQIVSNGTNAQTNNVVYSRYNGAGWDNENFALQAKDKHVDSAIDSANKVGLIYSHNSGFNYAKWNGAAWDTLVHPSFTDAWAVEFSSTDVPYIVVTDGVNIKVAHYTSSTWFTTTAYSSVSSAGWSADIALDSNDNIGVVFLNNKSTTTDVVYLRFDGLWTTTIVKTFASDTSVFDRARIHYDSANNPVILYPDHNDDFLKMARLIGGAWEYTTINPNDVGKTWSDMVIKDDSTYHICRQNTSSSPIEHHELTFGKNVPETTRHEFDAGTVSRTIAEYDEYDAGTVARTLSEYGEQDRDLK